MSQKPKTYPQDVSAVTGQTVTKEFADANPRETYTRNVLVGPTPKRDAKGRFIKTEKVLTDDAPLEEPTP